MNSQGQGNTQMPFFTSGKTTFGYYQVTHQIESMKTDFKTVSFVFKKYYTDVCAQFQIEAGVSVVFRVCHRRTSPYVFVCMIFDTAFSSQNHQHFYWNLFAILDHRPL